MWSVLERVSRIISHAKILANDARVERTFENLLLAQEYELVRIAFLIDTREKKAEMIRHTTQMLETWLVTLRATLSQATALSNERDNPDQEELLVRRPYTLGHFTICSLKVSRSRRQSITKYYFC